MCMYIYISMHPQHLHWSISDTRRNASILTAKSAPSSSIWCCKMETHAAEHIHVHKRWGHSSRSHHTFHVHMMREYITYRYHHVWTCWQLVQRKPNKWICHDIRHVTVSSCHVISCRNMAYADHCVYSCIIRASVHGVYVLTYNIIIICRDRIQ